MNLLVLGVLLTMVKLEVVVVRSKELKVIICVGFDKFLLNNDYR